MKPATLRWVLAAWVIAVIAPGAITTIAFDLHTDDSTDSGWPFAIVIVGYLVQLALFVAAVRHTSGMHAISWFAVSLLPWVVIGSTPWELWTIIPSLAVALLIAWTIYAPALEAQHLIDDGVPATGVVLEVIKPKLFNVTVNNVYILRKVRLRVERSDGVAPYEITHKGLFMLGSTPDEGDRLSLLIDRDDPHKYRVASDAASEVGVHPNKARPRQTAPAHRHAPAPLADQLERLAQLHTSGKLTDDEYSQAKRSVLADA